MPCYSGRTEAVGFRPSQFLTLDDTAFQTLQLLLFLFRWRLRVTGSS